MSKKDLSKELELCGIMLTMGAMFIWQLKQKKILKS
jgi:hypothetical protein